MIKSGIIVVAALLLTSPLSAQATRLIDPLDPAYRDVERLADAGLIERISLAQRPLSRATFARVIEEASEKLARRSELVRPAPADGQNAPSQQRWVFLRDLIASLRERLDLPGSVPSTDQLTLRVAPIRALTVDFVRTDQLPRFVPRGNGLGDIDAKVNTILPYRQGRPVVDGTMGFLETNHTLETSSIALSASPSLSMIAPNGGKTQLSIRLQELDFRYLFRNLALDIGREYLVWGQGRDAGLLNSNNSPPLNLVRLSNEEPFTFPWVFRRLGPTKLSLFYADLGADQNFPHAYAIAYRLSILPTSHLEFGASVYTKSGGRGAPPATLTARLLDLLPFLDASAYNNVIGTRGDFQFSDHYVGVDGRLRFPSLGASFFWEVLLNDFDIRRLESVLWEDAGHVFGLDLPRLLVSGRLHASLEYHHTGVRYYEHLQFTSGQTVHQTLTGDPLGPNAEGLYANVDWYLSVWRRLGAALALERRSNNQYVFIPEPDFGFKLTEQRPKEWTARALATWQMLPARQQLGGLLQLGYERTRNFNFVSYDDRNGVLGRAALQYRFH